MNENKFYEELILAFVAVVLLAACGGNKTCPACFGVGSVSGYGICPACHGEKEVSSEKFDVIVKLLEEVRNNQQSMDYEQKEKCPLCSGSGVFRNGGVSTNCSPCNATGYVSSAKAAQLSRALREMDIDGNGYDDTNIDYPTPTPAPAPKSDYDNRCVACNGTGYCLHCKGIGVTEYKGEYGMSGDIDKCPICHGNKKCGVCFGSGKKG